MSLRVLDLDSTSAQKLALAPPPEEKPPPPPPDEKPPPVPTQGTGNFNFAKQGAPAPPEEGSGKNFLEEFFE